jgi:hypothetical protein
MPIRLAIPLVKEYTLAESDEAYGIVDQPTRISIRQATQGQHEKRAALFANIIREWSNNAEGFRLVQRFSFEELKRIEVQLTLAGSSIEAEDGSILFKFNDKGFITDEAAFRKAWDALPPMVAAEIHKKVIELNVDWRPQGE